MLTIEQANDLNKRQREAYRRRPIRPAPPPDHLRKRPEIKRKVDK